MSLNPPSPSLALPASAAKLGVGGEAAAILAQVEVWAGAETKAEGWQKSPRATGSPVAAGLDSPADLGGWRTLPFAPPGCGWEVTTPLEQSSRPRVSRLRGGLRVDVGGRRLRAPPYPRRDPSPEPPIPCSWAQQLAWEGLEGSPNPWHPMAGHLCRGVVLVPSEGAGGVPVVPVSRSLAAVVGVVGCRPVVCRLLPSFF